MQHIEQMVETNENSKTNESYLSWLFQVEYAIEAIRLGSTVIGIYTKEGVVLAPEVHHFIIDGGNNSWKNCRCKDFD